jgi:hypothetical protein
VSKKLKKKQDLKGFQSLAANISAKLVLTTLINTYLVSQIPICKMESQILALKNAIGISNTNRVTIHQEEQQQSGY